jgi:hypothetical protein
MSAVLRPFVVFGFASVHDTLAAEAVLEAASIGSVVIPSPKELGGLCGIALRVAPEDARASERALSAGGHSPAAQAAIRDL